MPRIEIKTIQIPIKVAETANVLFNIINLILQSFDRLHLSVAAIISHRIKNIRLYLSMKSTCDVHRSLYVYFNQNLTASFKKCVCKYCKCSTAKYCKFVCESMTF